MDNPGSESSAQGSPADAPGSELDNANPALSLDAGTTIELDEPDLMAMREGRMDRNLEAMKAVNPAVAQAVIPTTSHLSREDQAAVCIQSHYRGHLGRKQYIGHLYQQFEKDEAMRLEKTLQQVEEGELLVENHRLQVQLDENSTTRRNKCRRYQAEIITIQRAWRAYQRRRLGQRKHQLNNNNNMSPSLSGEENAELSDDTDSSTGAQAMSVSTTPEDFSDKNIRSEDDILSDCDAENNGGRNAKLVRDGKYAGSQPGGGLGFANSTTRAIIEADPESVVSDYSEMADPIKEHLANVQIIQKEDLDAGNTMFQSQFSVQQKITRTPDETDEQYMKRLRKINYLSLAQEFAALKKIDADALPFDLHKGKVQDLSPMSDGSTETDSSERYLSESDGTSAAVTPLDGYKDFVDAKLRGSDVGNLQHRIQAVSVDAPIEGSVRAQPITDKDTNGQPRSQMLASSSATVCGSVAAPSSRGQNHASGTSLSLSDDNAQGASDLDPRSHLDKAADRGEHAKSSSTGVVTHQHPLTPAASMGAAENQKLLANHTLPVVDRAASSKQQNDSRSGKKHVHPSGSSQRKDDKESRGGLSPHQGNASRDLGGASPRKDNEPGGSQGDFDVYNIETALPQMDWAALEEQLTKAAEEEELKKKSRRTDREEIRRKLAMGQDEEYYGGERMFKKPNLQTRLQSGMNLQICFMNVATADQEALAAAAAGTAGTDGATAGLAAGPATAAALQAAQAGDGAEEKALREAAVAAVYAQAGVQLKQAPPSSRNANSRGKCSSGRTEEEEDEDFFAKQAKLQAEARMALAQVRPMAHMQLQVEKQMRKKSPIAEIVGIPGIGDGKRVKLSKNIMHQMNLAQLQVVVNDLHAQIETLNEELVRLLVDRDDAHMEQDSMLVDIEDLTRRAQESSAKVNLKNLKKKERKK